MTLSPVDDLEITPDWDPSQQVVTYSFCIPSARPCNALQTRPASNWRREHLPVSVVGACAATVASDHQGMVDGKRKCSEGKALMDASGQKDSMMTLPRRSRAYNTSASHQPGPKSSP